MYEIPICVHPDRGGVLSLCVIAFGVRAILINPVMSYRNYWGGMVFGPFAILIGLLFFVVTVLAPEKIGKSASQISGADKAFAATVHVLTSAAAKARFIEKWVRC